MTSLLRHLKGNLVAYVALFFALSLGTAWALGANTVRSKHIVNGQVKAPDLAAASVKGKHLDAGVPTDMDAHGEDSALNSANKTLTIECVNPDHTPISGGALIEGGEGFVALSESRMIWPPAFPNVGWRVSAIEVNGGTADDWKLVGTVTCARVR